MYHQYYCYCLKKQSWLAQTRITMYDLLLFDCLKTKLTYSNLHHYVSPIIVISSQNKVDLLKPASPCITNYRSSVSKQSWFTNPQHCVSPIIILLPKPTSVCITNNCLKTKLICSNAHNYVWPLLLYCLKIKLTCSNPQHYVLPTIVQTSYNKVDLL